MEAFIFALRIILAIIFGVAGSAKLADLKGSRKALADFDVPLGLIPALSIALPVVEIAIAVGLLNVDLSWFASIGAMALLAAFSIGMIVQMRSGNAPDCHCFGQLHSEPVGVKSLVRNIIIMVPAGYLLFLWKGNQGLSFAYLTPEIIQMFLIGLGVVILGAMAFYLRSISIQQTEIIRRIELLEVISRDGSTVERDEAGSPHDGLPIGAIIPDLRLRGVDGVVFDTSTLRKRSRPTLLIFVSTTCGPCQALLPRIDEWADDLRDKLDITFVSSGTVDENIEKFGSAGHRSIMLQEEREFADLVSARWTPSALLVSSDGRIASHIAAGDSSITELITRIKANGLEHDFDFFELSNGNPDASQARVAIGESIPDFSVTAIDGQDISAADFRGRQTLVTFWSPTCPHCVNMIDQIKDWETIKSLDEPALIVFSDGEEDAHREIGLRSPIVLDKSYKVAQKLGMHGTPSAVLVDSEGKFASELAIGAPNIWALIGKRMPGSN